jgi:hypothetical protein
MLNLWHVSSRTLWNSEPPSTYIAIAVNAIRLTMLEMKRAAADVVVRNETSNTSHRETASPLALGQLLGFGFTWIVKAQA